MYQLDQILSGESFAPGTCLLVTGSSSTERRQVGLRVLGAGSRRGEGAIVVTTEAPAVDVFERYAEVVDDTDDVQVGVVDCVGRDRDTDAPDLRVKHASSPGDLTQVGIEVSEFLREFREVRGFDRNRVLLDSISTMVAHTDVETVFRFLHVFNSRIETAEAFGVCLIDSPTHDSQTLATFTQLFDGVVTVGDGREPTLRRHGIARG
jgi:KaiC/GvpD/RAD55 family RecA-like ATPase